MDPLVDVIALKVIGDHRLRLTADGAGGDVDFAGREWQGVVEPLCDPAYFAHVEVDPEAGMITWPEASTWPPSLSTAKLDATSSTPRAQQPDDQGTSGVSTLAQRRGTDIRSRAPCD